MLEFARYYGRRRVKGALAMTAGFALLVALYVWMFPSVSEGIDLDAYTETLPPALREAFGLQSLGTIEGFLAAELYAFGWVLLLGVYFAYAAAGLVADDVDRGRMDMLLSLPVTRSRVLLEKFASVLVPLVVVNVVTPVVVALAVLGIDESISLADLAMVHALSVPYLLVAAAVGLLASVVFDRASVAQRVAAGGFFGLFLIDSVTAGTDVAALGALSPSRYYDPTAILVSSEWDFAGAGVLLAGTLVLLAASRTYWQRKDVA
ncbi:ABC transporter permease subunit [Halorubellus sp. JP-L1]|uniref:ABC transporter permease subunit n=1 Tax=Halorubellus sp. JP-L1 TaxID=2715753 RepID=UPI001877AF3D|nr:ABC transporter permease subunit [Halorubellus sp. JP-L1]